MYSAYMSLLTESDVNECTEGTHTCHAQAYCTDTVGGYSCTCNSGYTGSGEECSGKHCGSNMDIGICL